MENSSNGFHLNSNYQTNGNNNEEQQLLSPEEFLYTQALNNNQLFNVTRGNYYASYLF